MVINWSGQRKRVFKIGISVLLAAMMTVFTGCRRGTAAALESREPLALERSELMLIVATERNRYEQIYTDQIWSAQVSGNGTTFQEYLLEQIKLFSNDLLVIGAMAEHYGITLDNSEKEQLRRLSQDYYSQLTAGDKAYTGADEEDVQNLYRIYCLASKAVAELTKNADLEISDNEAKVIEICRIVLRDREEAQEIAGKALQEGADFAALARAHSCEEEIQQKLGRGEAGAALEEAAFSLETGEISPVVEEGGQFYIVKCLNDYDLEATGKRKEELSLLRKDKAFRKLYDQFLEEYPITISEDMWQDIRCETAEDTTTTNFFELYQEYFPG
ncbi:MAG: peptidylprolyl isomerase [Lachnospiraceae bacterium]|nr:peptidylprolyl isomerase [Lachnospiraceae bacterium]